MAKNDEYLLPSDRETVELPSEKAAKSPVVETGEYVLPSERGAERAAQKSTNTIAESSAYDPLKHILPQSMQENYKGSVAQDISKTTLPALGSVVAGLGALPEIIDSAISGYGYRKAVNAKDWLAKKLTGQEPEGGGLTYEKQMERYNKQVEADSAANRAKHGFDVYRPSDFSYEKNKEVLSKLTGEYDPQTTGGQFYKVGVEFVPGMIGGGTNLARNFTTNVAAPAILSEGAARLVNNPEYEPYARVLGALAGQGVGSLGYSSAAGTANALSPILGKQEAVRFPEKTLPNGKKVLGEQVMNKDNEAIYATQNQQRLAATALQDALNLKTPQEKAAFIKSIEQSKEGLPEGFKPTTYQATKNPAMGEYDRQLQNEYRPAFVERLGEQNKAMVDAIEKLQQTGAPEDVVSLFKAHRDDLDASLAQKLGKAETGAYEATTALGEPKPASVVGTGIRGAVEKEAIPAEEQMQNLYKAVDPEGKSTISIIPIDKAVSQLKNDMHEFKAEFHPEETRLLNKIENYNSNIQGFNKVADFRKDVNQVITKLSMSGDKEAAARMMKLKSAVDDSIDNALEHKAALEQAALSRGEILPDQTMAARLQQQANQFLAERQGKPIEPTQTFGIPSISGEEAGKLREANKAFGEFKQTYGTNEVGKILEKEMGRYKLPDEAVMSQIFKPGNEGAASVNRYLTAAKSSPEAIDAVKDAALYSLQSKGIIKDGIVDPKKFDVWKRTHQEALSALPEDFSKKLSSAKSATEEYQAAAIAKKQALDAYDKSEFGKLIGAQDGKEAVSRLGKIFDEPNSNTKFSNIVNEIKSHAQKTGDISALDGLRRAVQQHIDNEFISNAKVGTTGEGAVLKNKFQNFYNGNKEALSKIYDKNQMELLSSIDKGLDQKDLMLSGAILPGRSATAQDMTPLIGKKLAEMNKQSESGNLVSFLTRAGTVGGVGQVLGFDFLSGAALAIAERQGEKMLAPMYAAGIKNIDDLRMAAALHPELAKAFVQMKPLRPGAGYGSEKPVLNALAKLSIYNKMQEQEPLQERKRGGRVNSLLHHLHRAKAEVTRDSMPILHMPDEAVHEALNTVRSANG